MDFKTHLIYLQNYIMLPYERHLYWFPVLAGGWKNKKDILMVIIHFISSKQLCFIRGQRQLILKSLERSSFSFSTNFLLRLIQANLQLRKAPAERKA